MPIKFSFKKLPVDAEGNAYDSLESFQANEIKKLFMSNKVAQNEGVELNYGFATAVVQNKEAILEILELTMDARPAARGVRKPRKAKAFATEAQAAAPAESTLHYA